MARTCIGLDLGSSAIKLTHLRIARGGAHLLNFGVEPMPADAISDGNIANKEAVAGAIRALIGRLRIKAKDAAVAISGNAVIIKRIFVPAMSPEELEEQIPIEAENHIPFTRADVDIDFQPLSGKNPQGQMEVLLVAAKRDVVAAYREVLKDAGLNPAVGDVATFALQNAFENAYEGEFAPGQAVALINIGASLSTINIVSGGQSAFTRDVSAGGNAFNEDIVRVLGGIENEAAEAAKIQFSEDGTPKDLERVLMSTSEQIAGEFQKSLDFFLASNPDTQITRIFLAGGSAQVPPLVQSIEARAHVPVEIMNPFRRVNVADSGIDGTFLRAHAAQAAISLGLALRSASDKFE
jgi:type IV pilus assembly protein PilM